MSITHHALSAFTFTLVCMLMPLSAAENFVVDGRKAVIHPAANPAEGKPWLWYAPALNGGVSIVQHKLYADACQQAGIAIAGYDLGEVRGAPKSAAQFTKFYDEMVKRGYSPKPILLGQSRGGMMTLTWAFRNPDKVKAWIGIYPVCNLASWSLKNSKAQTLADFGLTEAELTTRLKEFNPPDNLAGLAAAKVPMFAVHGDNDVVVPHQDNTLLIKARYEALGGKFTVKIVPGEGHKVGPSFFACPELVEFLLKEAK